MPSLFIKRHNSVQSGGEHKGLSLPLLQVVLPKASPPQLLEVLGSVPSAQSELKITTFQWNCSLFIFYKNISLLIQGVRVVAYKFLIHLAGLWFYHMDPNAPVWNETSKGSWKNPSTHILLMLSGVCEPGHDNHQIRVCLRIFYPSFESCHLLTWETTFQALLLHCYMKQNRFTSAFIMLWNLIHSANYCSPCKIGGTPQSCNNLAVLLVWKTGRWITLITEDFI